MKRDFSIGQSNELLKAGEVLDLHNQYDFSALVLKTSACELRLLFEPNPEFGKGKSAVTIVFEGVDYLELSPGFGTRRIRDLEEMGYKNPFDRDDHWLLEEKQSKPEDHIFFRFVGDEFIRAHCSRIFIEE